MNKKIIIPIVICAIIIVAVIIVTICLNMNSRENEKNIENTESSINAGEETKEAQEDKVDKEYTDDKKEKEDNEDEVNNETNEDKEEEKDYTSGKHHATIKVKNYGTIKLELDADTAPITVANFAKLVNEGFYNGLTFHRIMSDFMIQGGDPLGNGTGGSSETIKGEFALNGVENNISHKRGVISMARATSYDSASSQFFIVHKDSTFLDGQYAAFGKVTDGMEVVDKICEDATPVDDNGTILADEQPIIEKITMED